MLEVGRLWRTLAPLPPSRHAARLVSEARERACRPLMPALEARWRRRSKALSKRADPSAARRLAATLSKWQAPTADALLGGTFQLAGGVAGPFPPADWTLPGCTPLQRSEAHYLRWLEPLVAAGGPGRELAAVALAAWLAAPAARTPKWKPYVCARRVLNCCRAAGRLRADAPSDPPADPLFAALIEVAATAALALVGRLEHHLGGNHLLTDRLALAASEALFGRPAGAGTAAVATWEAQLSRDGGHLEGSPMYHAILLEDALVVAALQGPDRGAGLQAAATAAAGWLAAVTHPGGELPAFGDCDPGALADLPLARAALTSAPTRSPDPRALAWAVRRGPAHVVMHTAPPAWSEQPGHAHDDSLTIAVARGGRTIVADAGLCGYQGDPRRPWNRSAAAHSTAAIAGRPGLELWADFRVGARGRVELLEQGEIGGWSYCLAAHTWPGGRPVHRRLVAVSPEGVIRVGDRLHGGGPAVGRLRLHHGIAARPDRGQIRLDPAGLFVRADAALTIERDRRFPRLGVQAPCDVLRYPITTRPCWVELTPRPRDGGPEVEPALERLMALEAEVPGLRSGRFRCSPLPHERLCALG